MVKVTFCLVADQQDITSFKNSKLVTAVASAGQGSMTPHPPPRAVFNSKRSSTDYAIQFVEAFRLRIKPLSSLCELQGTRGFQMHDK